MKKLIVGLFISLVLALSSNVNAATETDYILTPIASYHIDREDGECEFNPGIQYQHFSSNTFFWTTGVFRNSHCNIAATAMIGFESYENKRFLGVPYGYGVMVGYSSGYPSPIVGTPFIRFGDRNDPFTVKLMVLPHPTNGVFGLGFSYRLGAK